MSFGGGLQEGTAGLIISVLNAFYVFLKFARLWELQHSDATVPVPRSDTNLHA